MRHILITGASGLIGRHLIDRLLAGNYRIYGLFNSSAPDLVHEKISWIKCDLMAGEIPGVDPMILDGVVHAAALSPTAVYSDELCFNTNRLIDRTVLDFCAHNKAIRIAYLSSIYIELYPEAALESHSRYLYQKRQAERELEKMNQDWISFRISSPYGRHQTYRNVLKRFIEKANAGEDLIIHGTGERTQDFVSANDVAEAIEIFLDSDTTRGVFNICSGQPVSMKELAGTIRSASGNRVNIVYSGETDSQENYRVNFDNTGTRKELGWFPRTSLEQGIKEWFNYLQQ